MPKDYRPLFSAGELVTGLAIIAGTVALVFFV
jgi:hypothetical protein